MAGKLDKIRDEMAKETARVMSNHSPEELEKHMHRAVAFVAAVLVATLVAAVALAAWMAR